VATGYEVELRVAVDDIIPWNGSIPVRKFYDQGFGTRFAGSAGGLCGAWDALVSGRADLVIGAPGEGPSGGGYSTRPLASIEWLFAVAPTHPLAKVTEPIPPEEITQVPIGRGRRQLAQPAAAYFGLLTGQDVLTVPDMRHKIAFQCAGLGVGYVPAHLVRTNSRPAACGENKCSKRNPA